MTVQIGVNILVIFPKDEMEAFEEEINEPRGRPQRQIARTLVSERVRANIARSRGSRGRRIIYSSDDESEESEEVKSVFF